MDSSETKNDIIASNSSDYAPVQDSTIFSYVSDLSPIKLFKGAVVAQSSPGLGSSPQVFTSPQINPQSQSSSLERPQCNHLSSEYSKQNDHKNDDVDPVICTPGELNTNLSYQVNSHDDSVHRKDDIASESLDKYLEELLKVDCDDVGHVANSSLKQSDAATPSSKDFADCINYNLMNGEQYNGHVNQQMSGVPRCCFQYDESQQNTVAKNCGSMSQSNDVSISRSFSSESQVLESSCAVIYAPANSVEQENIDKPTSFTFHAPKFGKSSIAVSRPSGIGLHLNSILNALPMGCGASASVKAADEDYIIGQGKMSFCTKDSHSIENAGNSPASSKAVDGLLKPTEHHSTSCDKREYTRSSPQKKRKRSTGFSDEDGCKRCNCKKTKCLKLYCDCFAAGYYCGQTCSCQGCFNSPEYEDTVLDTRRKIVSRDPLAFAPKVLQHEGESPANNIQDINKSTPSSARHKRGCNCKKSMCLKRYCECYQSNIGCSDGCRCDGCKNVYGKKEEYGMSKHIAITEATNDIPEISFDQKLDTILHSELSIPHNMTAFTPLFQHSDQPCPGSGSFSSLGSRQLGSSPITSVVPFGENKDPMVLDSDSRCYNISEDDDIPEILKEHPISFSEVEVRSPNKKRISPPHSRLSELRSSSTITGLRGGRKFILKAVPSFPPLAPCIDAKSTGSQSKHAENSNNIK